MPSMPHNIVAAAIFKCRDMRRSLEFYQALGGVVNWHYAPTEVNPAYASIQLWGAEIHLSSFAGDGAFGSAVYYYVDDLAAIEKLVSQFPDAHEHGPEDAPWGMREIYLRDPDNNQLRVGMRLVS